MVTSKVVLLNGPPGCGKDTIAALLAERNGIDHLEAKNSLFRMALAISGVSNDEWFARYNDRELKEEPWDRLAGYSCRGYLIWISEKVVKPVHGKGHMGYLACAGAEVAMDCGAEVVVFSDAGGFQGELDTYIEKFGADSVLLVHLFRDGYNFDGDSRNYGKPNGCGYLPIMLEHGHPEKAVNQILKKIAEMDGV